MSKAPGKLTVITAAQRACLSLSRCVNFFNFEESDSWLGWENWVTVDIGGRVDHKAVVRFCVYPKSTTRSDLLINGNPPLTVEVKVNYVDDTDLDRWGQKGSHALPRRVLDDLRKLDR